MKIRIYINSNTNKIKCFENGVYKKELTLKYVPDKGLDGTMIGRTKTLIKLNEKYNNQELLKHKLIVDYLFSFVQRD